MYARDVERTAGRLRELRFTEWEDLGLAALAFGLAIVATELWPTLALPVFVGGLTVGALGIRALWLRWDLVDRLAGERDAYVIPEVLAYAARETTRERRVSFAGMIQDIVRAQGHPGEGRIEAVAGELESLARALEDDALELDPAIAIECSRLLTGVDAALFDDRVSVDELRARIRHLQTGFAPRHLAA